MRGPPRLPCAPCSPQFLATFEDMVAGLRALEARTDGPELSEGRRTVAR